MKTQIKDMLKEYKVTVLTLVLLLLSSSFLEILQEILAAIDKKFWLDLFDNYLPDHVTDGFFRFLILFAFGCLFAEICKGSWKRKTVVILFSALASAFFAYQVTTSTWNRYYYIPNVNGNHFYDRAQEWMAAYLILMILAILYVSFKKSGMSFSLYATKLMVHTIMAWGISLGVLIIGTMFILIVEALFPGASFWTDTAIRIILYLTCFCGVIGMIWFLQAEEETDNKEIEGIGWQILPAALVGAVEVGVLVAGYMYGIKLLILRELPSNEVFEMIACIFVLSMPTWIIGNSMSKESICHKLLVKLPWVFAPLILLQILSMGMRVFTYGLTQERYLGIMFILFEGITLVLWKVRREHLESLLTVLFAMVVISVFVPGINMTSLSQYQQERWLIKYSETSSELTEREFKRLEGAYEFLWKQKGSAYMEKNYAEIGAFLDETDATGRGYVEKEANKLTWYDIHGCQMVGKLDVTGFRTMNMVNESEIYQEYVAHESHSYIEADFSQFRFVIRETGEEVAVDLSRLYEEVLKYVKENPNASQEEQITFLKERNKIELDDGSVLYINHFQVSWFAEREDGKEVFRLSTGMNISGMLLQK